MTLLRAGIPGLPGTDGRKTRVFLLDDHGVVREGLRALLEGSGGRPPPAARAGPQPHDHRSRAPGSPTRSEAAPLTAEGLTNRQIGERMFLAEKTVKNYVSSILSRLGLERRTQDAVMASELLDPGR